VNVDKKQTLILNLCLGFMAALALIALFAPWIAPYPYDLQNVDNIYASPSAQHWFGTDSLGRDLFSRLVYGCRISVSIAIITGALSIVIGVIMGTLAGYYGGLFERVLMRTIDTLYALPSFIIMILVMLVVGRDMKGIIIALTITGWLGTARLMRAQVKSFKHRDFVEAARSLGATDPQIITRHILPNCLAPILVELSYQIPTNILAEAFLSFLGIGIRPPTPSWGVLADEGWRALEIYPHLTIFPGLMIFLTMLVFNTAGDTLRDKWDPFKHR
jgi:ABC-type dipeptide/oligopeptide/nickel transport system permease subunit